MPVLLGTLGRVLAPLVTPFDDRDELNTEALANLVDFVIEKDYADTLIVAESTGDFYALSREELLVAFATVKEAYAGRLALVADFPRRKREKR